MPGSDLAVLASFLCVMEAGFRLFRPGYIFYSRTEPGQFTDRTLGPRDGFRKDPDLGWILNDGALLSGAERPPFLRAHIATKQGFRDTKDFSAIDYRSDKTRVMMLGDLILIWNWAERARNHSRDLGAEVAPIRILQLGDSRLGDRSDVPFIQKICRLIKPQIVVLLYIDDDVSWSYEAFRIIDGMNKPSFFLSESRLVPGSPNSM
jgi:hypothetical protein